MDLLHMMQSGFTLVPTVFISKFNQLDLTGDEAILLIYLIYASNQQKDIQDLDQVAAGLAWSVDQLYDTLASLLDKGYIHMDTITNQEGKQSDHYSIQPFFNVLENLASAEDSPVVEAESSSNTQFQVATHYDVGQLLDDFQMEFGRNLSSMELEMVSAWVDKDQQPPDLIRLALKEAILNQAPNIKYIDKILLNWQKRNIRTAEEAKAYIEERSGRILKTKQRKEESLYDQVEIPIYDWDFK
ncbi:DnaD domain-containing protein [Hutsoniella sourekii]|uniref:DnaD domain-containing protein n=1 Tax=Hutsoniella sourekii TaxID=87650 RepID=UPI000485D1F4|nr:DnaD domain protein [Hutsoniella sourekii]